MSSRTSATWYLSLDCDCPKCDESVDLLDGPDFWGDHVGLAPCETMTELANALEVVCPKCGHEFEVRCEY